MVTFFQVYDIAEGTTILVAIRTGIVDAVVVLDDPV